MKLSKLRSEEITSIYQERLVKDFIPEEVKPLSVILRAVENGTYECLGLFDDSEIVGYTFLVKQGIDYLIDYIAIIPGQRNKGLGGEVIGLLREYLAGAEVVIGEVEYPDYTYDSSLKDLQTRRIGFYKRNGCTDTGLRVRCFGVPFIILELKKGSIRSEDKLWETYRSFYGAVFPKDIVEKNVEWIKR